MAGHLIDTIIVASTDKNCSMLFLLSISDGKYCELLQATLPGQYHEDLDLFGQNHVTIYSLVYKVTLKHQENVINQLLKEEQIMECSSPFWKRKCEKLKEVRLTVLNFVYD